MSSEDKAIITVRLIRSFEHRNVKHVVFKDVDVHLTTTQFMEFVKNNLSTQTSLPPPVRNYSYDTMKIQHKSHGAKDPEPGKEHPATSSIRNPVNVSSGTSIGKTSCQLCCLCQEAKLNQTKALTSDPVINTENDDKLILKPDISLKDGGVENETEISFFKLQDYLAYQANPHTEW